MNIVVCVKQVVDTEAVIALDGAGEVELTGQTMVIDPYSESVSYTHLTLPTTSRV